MTRPPPSSPPPSRGDGDAHSRVGPPAPPGAICPKTRRGEAVDDPGLAEYPLSCSLVAPRAGSSSLTAAGSPSRREGAGEGTSGAEGPTSVPTMAVVTPALLSPPASWVLPRTSAGASPAEMARPPPPSSPPSRCDGDADSRVGPPAPPGAICPKTRRGEAVDDPGLAEYMYPLSCSLVAPRAGSFAPTAAGSPSRREGAGEGNSGAEGPSSVPTTAVVTPALLSPPASWELPKTSAGASLTSQSVSPSPSRSEGLATYDRKEGEPPAPLGAIRPDAKRRLDIRLEVVEGPAPPEVARGKKAGDIKCVACLENLNYVRTNINLAFAKYRRKKRRSLAPQIDVRPDHKYNTRSRAKRARNLQLTRSKRPRPVPAPGSSVSPGPAEKRSRQPSPPPQGTDILGANFPT